MPALVAEQSTWVECSRRCQVLIAHHDIIDKCQRRFHGREARSYGVRVRTKHARTLARVFEAPSPASLRWDEVEAMLLANGARLASGRGSRDRIERRGVRAVFHRPHPGKELDRGAWASLRRFLEQAEVTP